MRRFLRVLGRVALVLVVLAAAGYGYFRYRNPPPQLREPNYFTYYKTQDREPVGKVAVLVAQLVMPEDYRPADYYNIALKSTQYIPWPIRNFATVDRGVLLLDEQRFYEFKEVHADRNSWTCTAASATSTACATWRRYARGEVIWHAIPTRACTWTTATSCSRRARRASRRSRPSS
ncbi:MAG: hypothetical protein U1F11_13350 [Steroidobacteraceae bacterium]